MQHLRVFFRLQTSRARLRRLATLHTTICGRGALLLALTLPLAACGASSGGVADSTSATEAQVELTEQELRKLDPRLVERMRKDRAGSLPVKVRFVQVPSDAELADLLLTRVGAVVVGSVTPPTLKRIAARPDVAEITWFAGAGYDDEDDGA